MKALNTAVHSERRELFTLFILSSLMSFASISTDIYLPALPLMREQFAGGAGSVEWTISGFLLGFSIGQLIWGPISDRYGRKMPIMIGMGLFLIGSVGCALSISAWQMIFWRCIQALGACTGPVLSRAMVRDLYSTERSAHMLSTLIMIMGIAPLLGPIIGGQILQFGSWHIIFWILAVTGALMCVAIAMHPETLVEENRVTTPLSHALSDYWFLIKDRKLISYIMTGAFFYLGAYAFIAGSPFAYIQYYHLPQTMYGVVFAINTVGIIIANYINRTLMQRYGMSHLFRAGVMILIVSGVIIMINAKTDLGGFLGLEIPLFIYWSMNGFIVANSVASTLSLYPQRAGAVSALTGALQYGSGIISTALLGWFSDGTPWTMGWIIGLSSIACFLSYQLRNK